MFNTPVSVAAGLAVLDRLAAKAGLIAQRVRERLQYDDLSRFEEDGDEDEGEGAGADGGAAPEAEGAEAEAEAPQLTAAQKMASLKEMSSAALFSHEMLRFAFRLRRLQHALRVASEAQFTGIWAYARRVLPSRIPSLCTHFTRAGIEWRR